MTLASQSSTFLPPQRNMSGEQQVSLSRLESERNNSRLHIVRSSNRRFLFAIPLILMLIVIITFIIFATRGYGTNYTNVNVTTSTIGYDVNMNVTEQNFDVKFGFTPVHSHCLEKYMVPLGENIFVSVCNPENEIVIDIRYFTGSSSEGIYPTIKGIPLTLDQWQNLVSYADTILTYVNAI